MWTPVRRALLLLACSRSERPSATHRCSGLLRARVDAARALLGTTKLSVDQIAVRVGLGTGSNPRLHFRRILDVSPSEYRAAFSGRTILTPGAAVPGALRVPS
ncbi:helix-turn-helix domain-containing protein [Streptomyces sp. NPDC059489]|uniref:helix-turn-helix domain-containing protein n=1 Tax=Streptomyces sp. NPDC059489 TaxID=3346849 RepID=UPI0036CE38CA